MYQPRTYREGMLEGRFSSFNFSVQESDLAVGYAGPKNVDVQSMRNLAWKRVVSLREEIKRQGEGFLKSLVPLEKADGTSPIIQAMLDAGKQANVGPMASVAGAIAQNVGELLQETFKLDEIIVENGGDLYLSITSPAVVKLVAPGNPLDGKLGVRFHEGVYGCATSSGKTGPSLSFGNADAVMIATRNNAALSDAYATAFANKVHEKQDVASVAALVKQEKAICFAVILCDDQLACLGDEEVVRL